MIKGYAFKNSIIKRSMQYSRLKTYYASICCCLFLHNSYIFIYLLLSLINKSIYYEKNK